jgi:hypothetical protein
MKENTLQKQPSLMLQELNLDKIQLKNPAPHCPNPECRYFNHENDHDTSWRKNHGDYTTKAFGTVPRYRCTACGKTFSNQTFLIDYWVKKPVSYLELLIPLLSTSGLGNITRFQGLRCELIQNRYERLSRMMLALHADLREQLNPDEDFVLDGFETFSKSQYFPNNVNILVGSRSEFIYGMSFAQLRRKGAMTTKQKKKRADLEAVHGKADPKAIEMSVTRLLEDIVKLLHSNNLDGKKLISDEHKAYERALKRVPEASILFEHEQHSSKESRTKWNSKFPVDYCDRQIRKDQANHVRETVQFARCPSAMMTRLCLYQMYHNYIMPRRVREQRKGNWETRGEMLGLSKQVFRETLNKVFGRRVFFNKLSLWEEEKKTWKMAWRNVGIRMGRRIPKYILL